MKRLWIKTWFFLRPRIWPFCFEKGCWNRNCVFAGMRVTRCEKHACKKLIDSIFELDTLDMEGPEDWNEVYSNEN